MTSIYMRRILCQSRTAFGEYTQFKLLTVLLWGERDKEQVTCLPRRLSVYTVFTSRIVQFWKQPCVTSEFMNI